MNYAVCMYKKVGFEIIDENDEEYIMMKRFNSVDARAVFVEGEP